MEIKENEKIVTATLRYFGGFFEDSRCFWKELSRNQNHKNYKNVAECLEDAIQKTKATEFQLTPIKTEDGFVTEFLLIMKVIDDSEDIPLI